MEFKETEPTPEDRRYLYVDCLKEATAALALGVETVPPDALWALLVQQFVQGVNMAGEIWLIGDRDLSGKSACSPSSFGQRL